MTETISQLLSILTILLQFFLVVLFILYFLKNSFSQKIFNWLKNWSPSLALIIVMTATLGSLFYSEVAGYLPCTLCWYQRIAMYPLVITIFMAIIRRELAALDYSLALASIGFLLAAYHNYIYFAKSPLGSCSASGQGTSCLIQYVVEFQYVTIPLMAVTAFLAVTILLLIVQHKE